MPRKVTIKVIEMGEEGMMGWEAIARECLSYMSEDDVADMVQHSQMMPIEEDDCEEVNEERFAHLD